MVLPTAEAAGVIDLEPLATTRWGNAAAIHDYARKLQGGGTPPRVAPSPAFTAALRRYQQQGLDWLHGCFTGEILMGSPRCRGRKRASMRPRLLHRGDHRAPGCGAARRCRFNEAPAASPGRCPLRPTSTAHLSGSFNEAPAASPGRSAVDVGNERAYSGFNEAPAASPGRSQQQLVPRGEDHHGFNEAPAASPGRLFYNDWVNTVFRELQ